MNVVLFAEFDGEGSFKSVEIGENEVDDFGAGGVFEEESCSWVLHGLWTFVVEVAF